jgi:hypothetical protein
MDQRNYILWYSVAGCIGVIFGVFYAIFGLESLPIYQIIVPEQSVIPWNNGLYGSTFIGFSVLLFFVGRRAFQTNDKEQMKALFYGITAWLVIEALFSVYYGVFLNVLVDVVLEIFLCYPIVQGIRKPSENKKDS